MLEELQRRNYSQSTAHTYLHAVEDLAKYFHRSPYHLGPDHIRQYQVHLFRDRKLSSRTIGLRTCALRFLSVKTVGRPYLPDHIQFPERQLRLPTILDQQEVTRLIDSARNRMHRAMMTMLYTTGLRRAEMCHSKAADIDSKRMGETLDREQIAAYLSYVQAVSSEHAADGHGRAIQLPRYLVDGPLHEFFAHQLDVFVGPSSMVHFSLEPIPDQKAPARFTRASGVALETDHQLLKLVSGKDPGLSSKSQSLRTPAQGAFGGLGGNSSYMPRARGTASRTRRFGTNRSGISILARAEEQKESLRRIESSPLLCRRIRLATMPTTSVEICFANAKIGSIKILGAENRPRMRTFRRVCHPSFPHCK